MGKVIVYSFKVEKEQLKRAKRFLTRQGALLQDSLRDFVEAAADCEQCLELHEEDASVSELQSAFATLLAKCRDAWYLNGLLQEAVLKIAKICKVPLDFIANVLGEARRAKLAAVRVRRNSHPRR
jgi:DNA-directed RNA polymerase specialized sigma24 family protein